MPTSTHPDDYFAVVDLYINVTKKRMARETRKWLCLLAVCPACPWPSFEKSHGNEMEPILHQGENPYSANMKDSDEAVPTWHQEVSSSNCYWCSSPLAYAAHIISREFEASPCHRIDVTFFPWDNAKSVSFMVLLLPTLIITIISFTLILNLSTTLWLEMIQDWLVKTLSGWNASCHLLWCCHLLVLWLINFCREPLKVNVLMNWIPVNGCSPQGWSFWIWSWACWDESWKRTEWADTDQLTTDQNS